MTTNMTDEELDREWKPNGRRPQSFVSLLFVPRGMSPTIARSFSAELMDIFRIENSISDLDQVVHQKKEKVDRTTKELASLEARLREMEARLHQRGQPARTPLAQFQQDPQNKQQVENEQAAKDNNDKARSRPGTARTAQQAPSSGNMPPTPGASEGEYYIITHADLHDGPR
ncbi:Fc.00g028790.m01.CDS01 [Cosmosporella sp. VM-42]